MSWPVITVPWKFCAQANHRLRPIVVKGRPRLSTNPEYSIAKQGAEYHIKAQWRGRMVTDIPLQLVARCYFPDKRKRDASNLSKLILDAMSGIVFEDDSQVEDERWIKAGYDKTDPRIEITLLPLDAAAA